MTARAALIVLAALLGAAPAAAHRLSPAFFGLTESEPGVFAVQWKVSISGGLAAALEPRIPEGCTLNGAVRTYDIADARVQLGELACPDGLDGVPFEVAGLPSTQTDVLLRVGYLDGSSYTARLTPDAPSTVIAARQGAGNVMRTYLVLGVEHILLGIDHLLFVLALLLLVRGVRRLVVTVTAFTAAHSITLGAATLGFVRMPQAAVEATIALSILFLASELARRDDGAAPRGADLTARFPWIVAFSFGLLHGFGFAGALSEIGMPQESVPLALLFFNVGVELGQLVFIAAVLALGVVLRRARLPAPAWWPRAVAYGIGTVAAFWTMERTAAIW
ncbi:MAG TPA: HupE/UreJ family protein [Gammaproteobacteria bacterium]